MAKATHKGTCQCCGSVQKLPNGVLSKHGYTVDWGFFNGVCQGAGHKPFEESIDLIDSLIKSAQKEIRKLNKIIKETLASTDTKKVWYHGYRNSTWTQKGGYFWAQREVIEVEDERRGTYFQYVMTEDDDKPRGLWGKEAGQYMPFNTNGHTLEDVVKFENAKYVEQVLNRHLNELKKYIKWQKERIKNWEPSELTEID